MSGWGCDWLMTSESCPRRNPALEGWRRQGTCSHSHATRSGSASGTCWAGRRRRRRTGRESPGTAADRRAVALPLHNAMTALICSVPKHLRMVSVRCTGGLGSSESSVSCSTSLASGGRHSANCERRSASGNAREHSGNAGRRIQNASPAPRSAQSWEFSARSSRSCPLQPDSLSMGGTPRSSPSRGTRTHAAGTVSPTTPGLPAARSAAPPPGRTARSLTPTGQPPPRGCESGQEHGRESGDPRNCPPPPRG